LRINLILSPPLAPLPPALPILLVLTIYLGIIITFIFATQDDYKLFPYDPDGYDDVNDELEKN